MKIHYKLVMNKSNQVSNIIHPIQIKNNKSKNNNDNNKLNNTEKSNIQINYEINSTDRINEHLNRVINHNNFKVSFWRVWKKFIFQKKDDFVNKIVKLRKFIISEEIMYKYYFIIHSLKNPIFEYDNQLKDFDLFKEDNLVNINYSKENKS